MNRIPGLPLVMLTVMGLWLVMASYVTFDPDFTVDRVNKQFVPVSQWIVQVFNTSAEPHTLSAMARVFQILIGTTEAASGVLLLSAVFVRSKRMALTNLGLCLLAGLFGAFLLTMFAMHDKTLPAWNQYPSIYAWMGVTWFLVAREEERKSDRAT